MISSITTAQMVEVDRLMVAEYGIELIQMMENAGRNLAEHIRRITPGALATTKILALCGTGNNGGGGMVAVRHLHNWGSAVSVALVGRKNRLKETPLRQWRILESLSIPLESDPQTAPQDFDVIIDAMLGYGLRGNPVGIIKRWIYWANNQAAPIIALDVPSGLDATSGIASEPCIQATATLTLALPKGGLLTDQAARYVGDLYLVDIGVPPELYRRMGLELPNLFSEETVLLVKPGLK